MTESTPENDVVITNNVGESAGEATAQKTSAVAAAAAADGNPSPIDAERKKKKSGAFAIFRAALLILRKRPGEKKAKNKTISKQKSTASVSNGRSWAKFVGSMRPLSGLQETAMSPPHQPSPVAADEEETKLPQKEESAVAEENETIPAQKEATAVDSVGEAAPPASPAVSSSSSSRGTMSQYASAASLRDLYCSDDDDEDEEEEDPDEVFDAITGDEMIDAKAEEFIAQFYKQIQLQNTSKTHHHYHNRGI